MCYEYSRLSLGILNVGFFVLICSLYFLLGIYIPIGKEVHYFTIPSLIFFYILISLPFDIIGGYILPKAYGRAEGRLLDWLKVWAKGVIVQGLIMALSLASLLYVFRSFVSDWVRVFYIILIQLVFAFLQPQIAKMVGNYKEKFIKKSQLVWESSDRGFTGGVTIAGTSVIPESYLKVFSKRQYDWLVQRRAILQRDPVNQLGALGAILFNTLGGILVLKLNKLDFHSSSDLFTFVFGMTLWSFVGVIFLPYLSQKTALLLDRFTFSKPNSDASRQEVIKAFQLLDDFQGAEPSRKPILQKIFHSLPSYEQRIQNLASKKNSFNSLGAWHIARRALFLSWPFMGLLNRAVHCNIGRPDLWVLLPCEG